jgi:hypothetical protein
MKRYFTAAAFIGVAAVFFATALATHASEAPAPAQAQAAAAIVFDELEHDFGKVGADQTVKHTFKFKNTGDTTLVIGDIKTTCGCTGTLLSQREIAPGSDGSLEVSFHSGGSGGQRRKSIFVSSNDPQKPSVKLDIAANVVVPVEVRPRTVYWVAEKNKKSMQAVELLYDPELKLRILGLELSSPAFSASYRPINKKDELGYTIDLSCNGSLPIGNFQEKLVILTDNPEHPKLEVALRGKVAGPVKVIPDAVALGVVKADQLPVRTVRVYSTSKSDFAITAVESSNPMLSYELNREDGSNRYEINVKLTQLPPTGAFSEKLTIKTNDPSDAVIIVPVYAYVK